MAVDVSDQIREVLFEVLLEKIGADRFPSTTMLDMAESLMQRPDEIGRYVTILIERVQAERFPSIPMLQRLQALT